jgi:DNA modification methylase
LSLYYQNEKGSLYHGDCLEIIEDLIKSNTKVDMVLCDLPYGVLNKSNSKNKWDTVIPFNKVWYIDEQLKKENGATVLFGQGMFSARLMLSNESMWKYNLVWKKAERTSGFLNANKMPMRNHEDILVFYKQQPTFNPQFTYGHKPAHKRGKSGDLIETNNCYGNYITHETRNYEDGRRFPKSVIDIDREHPTKHPCQKPVALCEWLIKSFTNEDETVLDFTCGVGSTLIAAQKTNRKFIGIELEEKYCEITKQRLIKTV